MTRVLVFILTFSTFAAAGQRLKYRDVAPGLDTLSDRQQISELWEYLLEDQNHPNANYRLAMLHYDIYRKSDPLLEYRKAMAHAREAHLRIIRARVLVTNQDVRSDNEYYAPLFNTVDSKGKPYVEFATVQAKMNTAQDSAQKFQEAMPPIYNAFTRSVRLYDKAVKLFAEINTQYNTLEDIYMFYDKDMDNILEELKMSYDSSVIYFNKYKSLIAEYPIGYRQELSIRDIQVYRMDGLITRLNFLSPKVELWNYSKWVEDVRKKYNEEIVGIRAKIEKTELDLTKALKGLEAASDASTQKVSKDLVFQLNNYDRNSLALALLEYKSFKQNLLLKLRAVDRDTAMESRLELYSSLVQLNRSTDTLATRMQSVMNDQSIRKHLPFLEKYYGGPKGVDAFVRSEKKWLTETFSAYRDILKEDLADYSIAVDQPGKTVRIGSLSVPLFVDKRSQTALEPSGIQTVRIARNADGSMYISGIHRTNKKTNLNAIAFIARLNPDGKAAWLKELNYAPDSIPTLDADNFIGDMVATQEGCGIVLSSVRKTTGASANSFVFVNDKGEIKSYRMEDAGIPRKIIYQESGNSFIMVFKGTNEQQQYDAKENISITSVNVLGDLLWHQDVMIAGILSDVVAVRDGYIIAGNYSYIKDNTGKEYNTRLANGQSNPFLVKLGLRGEIVSVQPVVSQKSIYIDRVVKVNDGSINLLGYESTFPSGEETSPAGNIVHMMTNYELRRICADF